jgi:hypothetical protein
VATVTATEAETPTSDLPPAAAIAQVWRSFSSPAGVIALTVIALPPSCAEAPTSAVLWTVTTLTETAAPTFAEASDFSDVPVALTVASVPWVAITLTAPEVPVTCRPAPIDAMLVTLRAETEIAAPTPAPLEPVPDCELALELA